MNPLQKRLASLRFKVRFLDGWLGACALVALILGVVVTEGVLDFWVHLPSLVRAVLLVGLLISSGYIAYRFIVRPFTKPCDDLNLALRIEEVYPELNDSLATTVQFLNQSKEDTVRLGASEAMRERTVKETEEKAAKCDFGRILDRRAAVLFGAAACCILLVAGLVVGMNRTYSQIAFWRFVEPFGMHTWTQITVERHAAARLEEEEGWKSIEPKMADRIAMKQKYTIKVLLEGQMPRKPEARILIEGQVRSDKVVPLKISDDKLSATFEADIRMTDQPQEFRFKILANDGTFPARSGTWQVVKVMPPPKLAEPPRITVYPPKYTDLKSPEVLEAGTGLVKVYAGSTVVLKGRAELPLKQAWLEYLPENDKLLDVAKVMAFMQDDPLTAAAQYVGGQAVWGRFPGKFEQDDTHFKIVFQPWLTGKFVLHLVDPDDLSTQISTDVTVLVDPVPDVKVALPRPSESWLPDAKVPFKFLVTDKEFAIKSVYIEYRAKPHGAADFGPISRTVLYDAGDFGRDVPQLLARMGKTPLGGPLPMLPSMFEAPQRARKYDLRIRHQQLEIESIWALRKQFNVGDLVEVIVYADDFCDVYPVREPGRGIAIELRIVSKEDILPRKELIDIQKRLQELVKLEEKALNTVKATRKQDKFDQKAHENFIENGEQPQRELAERTDALRRDLREIRKRLKDNNLTDEPAYRDADKVQGVLDSIAQTELPQITPKLADVRADVAKGGENKPKTQKKLDEAAKLQESVLKSLRELIKEMNPVVRMNEIIDKVRDINQKEKEILQKLDNLRDERQLEDRLTPDEKAKMDKNHKERIDQIRREQNEVADETAKLLKEMQEARDEFEDQMDKANFDKLDAAIKKLQPPTDKKPMPDTKPPITAQMKEVAKELENKKEVPQKVLEKEKDIVRNLDDVLKSLEGPTEATTQKQIQERKDAQEKVEKIEKDLDRLREEAKKGKMIEDKEERLKENEKLAAKAGELQNRIEDTRRELARLNEQRPANELKDAADKLDRVKEELNKDGNAEQPFKDAKKDLKRAEQELKQAQDELARELLVKIADQLEGLKIRQVASLERSELLHTKIMERKSWTEAFLDTMDRSLDTQKLIADETDTFKEKLKEAKVFESLLDKAKKAMDKAVEVMEKRREEGKDRRYLEKGEKMPADELKEEVAWQDETVRQQKTAVKKLEILLDSIKEEIDRMKAKQDEERAKADDPMNDPDKEQPPMPKGPGDGLPPMAQLKALRAEQFDLNERFKDFTDKNPDLDKLNNEQKALLQELTDEQAAIRELFLDITRVPEPPAPAPNDKKEGDKK